VKTRNPQRGTFQGRASCARTKSQVQSAKNHRFTTL